MKSAKHRNVGSRKMDRGAVLMVVLIVMIGLLGLGMTGLFLTSGSIQMNTNIALRNQALAVAEAGIERARGILNSTAGTPPVPDMLSAFGSPTAYDEIPTATASATDTDYCLGKVRGAILVESSTSQSCPSPPCHLKDVAFPTPINNETDWRTKDLPSTDLTVSRPTMGSYTVYIRQDPADCRMGNFTCEYASLDTSTSSTTTTGTDIATITNTSTPCTPPAGAPVPNGALVVRSEGVAADGKTRVVLEVTMTPSRGAAQAANTPLSALCASGAAGCDDNASVQNGIVVNSGNPMAPPPPPPPTTTTSATSTSSGTSTGSTTSTDTSTSTGTGTGTGTTTLTNTGSSTSTGTSTSTSTGTGTTTPTATATATNTNTNTDTCVGSKCSQVGYLGEFGMWDPNFSSDRFVSWLKSNYPDCAEQQQLVFQTASGGKTLTRYNDMKITPARLKGYSALVLLDMYHAHNDFVNCTKPANKNYCAARQCYRPSGTGGLCTGVPATATSASVSTDPWVISGCPKTATMTATVTSTYNWAGVHSGNASTKDSQGVIRSGWATFTQTSNSTGVFTTTISANCVTSSGCYSAASYPTSDCYTSYNYSSGRRFDSDEVQYLQQWIESGHGIVTTASYFYNAPELANANSIISKYGIKYAALDNAGHMAAELGGLWGYYNFTTNPWTQVWSLDSNSWEFAGGEDMGQSYNNWGNDFLNNQEPLFHQEPSGYSKKVLNLQVRGGTPLVPSWLGPGNGNWTGVATPGCIVNVKQDCPLPNPNQWYFCNNPLKCMSTAQSRLPMCAAAKVDGGAAGSGRVLAWSDEWLTYDAVWGAIPACSHRWQADYFWENVVRWLAKCQ
jgi:hypothetical protein